MRIAAGCQLIRSQRSICCAVEQAKPEVVEHETKVEDGQFPAATIEEAGYRNDQRPKSYNGVALLSREPRGGSDWLRRPAAGHEAAIELSQQKRVISAWVDGVRVLNLYVPNGSEVGSEKYAYKLAWLDCLRRYLDVQREQEPFCMLGDFNIGPEARDLHNPERSTGGIMASR